MRGRGPVSGPPITIPRGKGRDSTGYQKISLHALSQRFSALFQSLIGIAHFLLMERNASHNILKTASLRRRPLSGRQPPLCALFNARISGCYAKGE